MKQERAARLLPLLLVACITGGAGRCLAADEGHTLAYRIINLEQGAPDRSRRLFRTDEFTCSVRTSSMGGVTVLAAERFEKADNGVELRREIIMRSDMTMIESRQRITGPEGGLIEQTIERYDSPLQSYPAGTFHFMAMPSVTSRLNLSKGAHNDLYFVFRPELEPWHIQMVVEAEEKVKVPAGTFSCCRMRLELDYEDVLAKWAWGARLFRGIVPDYYFWMNTEPPHELARFEEKFGFEQTAPRQAWELVSANKAESSGEASGENMENPGSVSKHK